MPTSSTDSSTSPTAAQLDRTVPRPAHLLGALGVVPFLACAVLIAFGAPGAQSIVQPYLVGYGIAILSFMGGVHWGLAMSWSAASPTNREHTQFTISVVPALAAWMTLFLPPPFQSAWLAVCFLLLLAVDIKLTRLGRAPVWYPSMRWPLSIVVVSCLCLTALPLGSLFGAN